MSHSAVIYSESGTPMPERTVGELVAERPGRSRIFQAHAIDFCCQGNRTLKEACERKGVPLERIVGELEEEQAVAGEPEQNPADLEPDALCHYIVEKHHGFLKEELPRVHAMAERVAQVHGGHTPSLVEVYQTFHEMAQELIHHMAKEEQILFPAIMALDRKESATLDLEGPITMMTEEHEKTGEALKKLQNLTSGYQPPPDACNTYRALFAGLEELEGNLQRHIHLENSVLFPAAWRLVSAADSV